MAGLLSDVLPWVYSQGDRAKRYMKGLLSDPVGSAQQTAGLLSDKHREMQALQAQAFPDQSRPFKVGDSRALGQMADAMLAGPLGFAPAGITVWHGSPHKFDKFDSSKIGTGEGAQAYGHGLYLAESDKVAGSYSGKLSSELTYNGRAMQRESGRNSRDSAAWALYLADGDKAAAKASGLAKPELIDALDPTKLKPGGQLYKVDLPDEAIAKMLDWDKPLSQQPRHIQDFFEPVVAPTRALEAQKPSAKELADWGELAAPRRYDPTGMELMQLLNKNKEANAANVLSGGTGGAASSAKLRQAGIPGIRYLDGGSRGAGGGTSNFVVFPGNEGLLSILERNGQPIR